MPQSTSCPKVTCSAGAGRSRNVSGARIGGAYIMQRRFFVLNLWAIRPAVCRVKAVWRRCAFSRHHHSRPAGIDPARGLPWRAGTHTLTACCLCARGRSIVIVVFATVSSSSGFFTLLRADYILGTRVGVARTIIFTPRVANNFKFC